MKTLDNLKINAINLYLTRRTDTRTQEDSKMYIANLVSDLETFDLLEVLNDNQALMEKHSAVFSLTDINTINDAVIAAIRAEIKMTLDNLKISPASYALRCGQTEQEEAVGVMPNWTCKVLNKENKERQEVSNHKALAR